MRDWQTLYVRIALVTIGALALSVFLVLFPQVLRMELKGDFDYGILVIGLYVAAVPFFISLFYTLKLLNLVDRKKVFSRMAVELVEAIKHSGYIASVVLLVGLPYVFYLANRDDAPGLFVMGLGLTGFALTAAASAGIVQKVIASGVKKS